MDKKSESKLISIKEAVEQNIDRLRLPIWANPLDHLKIDIVNGRHGPWFHLYSPSNKAINGQDPMSLIYHNFDLGSKEWEPYTGALPTSDEYKEAAAGFDEIGSKMNS